MPWSVREPSGVGGPASGARRPGRGGFALMLVMIVILSAFVLGMGYLCSASVRLASSGNFVAGAKAHSAAEAALEHAKHILYTNPSSVLSITQASPMGPYVLEGNTLYRFYFAPVAGTGSLYRSVGVGSCGRISVSCSSTIRARSRFASILRGLAPLSYWRLGETSGTLALDQMWVHNGWYMNGVTLGQPSPLLGERDTAARFDGTDDYVNLGQFNVYGSALTILAWVKPEAGDMDGRCIVAKPNEGDSANHCWSLGTLYASDRNQFFFRVRGTTGTTMTLLSGGTPVPDQWAFVVGVYDGTNMILYQDGVEVARTTKSGTIRTRDTSVWIGGNPNTGSSNRWKGCLDEVAIFQSALSAAQVWSLWDARSPELTIMSSQE